MSTITYSEHWQEILADLKKYINENPILLEECEFYTVPSIRMTDEMKKEQRMLHLGKKRSKQACRNISKSKTLGNHNLAKSYLLISPTGEEIFVPKGEMNIVAPKYDLNPNMLRHNATKIRKNGTPFKHRKWITQLVC